MGIYADFKDILALNKDTTKVVVIYALAIAILSLAIPISVQSLVNIISFGTLLQPIIVLTITLFIILSMVASIRIAQAVVVETIQQNVFARLGIQIADYLPHVKMENFDKARGETRVNFFFEIQTIQKSIAVLLVIAIELLLLSIFSMILIAFYHPLLLAFDVVLIIVLAISLYWPWKKALYYAIRECEVKHSIVEWLENVSSNILLFKFNNNPLKVLQETDKKIISYLEQRKKHFTQLLKHICSINIIYVVANSALLGIGGYLVVKEQLSLGQLVASELLVNALLFGFVRFSFYLEEIYDLVASCHKITWLTKMSLEEKPKNESSHNCLENRYDQGIAIKVKNLQLKENIFIVKDLINFEVRSGQTLVLFKKDGQKASFILDMIIGLRDGFDGSILVNELPIQDCNLNELRIKSALVRSKEIFFGSLRDNLTLGQSDINNDQIYSLLSDYHLKNMVSELPDGLNTSITWLSSRVSEMELLKITWIRVMIQQPKLLLIDYFIDYFFNSDLDSVITALKEYSGTIVLTTRRKDILTHFSKQIEL